MNRPDPGAIPMAEPIAYFLTWSTYGSWLPGDKRGWVEFKKGEQAPDPVKEQVSKRKMIESPCVLSIEQRLLVEDQIRQTCNIRGWELHAVACRSNHVHIVVTADLAPESVISQLKSWSTRRLMIESVSERSRWWAERGSRRYLSNEASLQSAIEYVLDGQEHATPKD